MLPNMRQRLIIATCAIGGGLIWLLVREPLTAADGASGISLLAARVGPVAAWGIAIGAGIPALVLAVLASTSGNPISGVFAGCAALTILAAYGGSMDGWVRRMQQVDALPGAYGGLIVEMLMWHAGLVAMLGLIQIGRSPLRTRIPALAFEDHLGLDIDMKVPGARSLLPGLVCAIVGGVIALLLLQVTDTAQVVLGLMFAFAVGGMVGHYMFPQSNPVGILFSPAVVAIGAYAYVLLRFRSPENAVLQAWFDAGLPLRQRVPGLAMALPIHYASAAVAGAALGIGWADGIVAARQHEADVSSDAPAPRSAGRRRRGRR